MGLVEDTRILSRPVPVRWAGWTTDTLRLQQAGWQIAVEHEWYRHQYRLLMKHREMHLYALSEFETYQWERLMQLHPPDPEKMPGFRVIHVSSDFRVQVMDDFTKFAEIDAQPQMVSSKIESVEDMNIFAPAPQTRTDEVFIDQADMTVIEHLEAIKELQDPKQKEIRQRMLRDREYGEGSTQGNLERTEVVAQLVALRA